MGVLDPGINALSILTAVLPRPVFLVKAELAFPENRDAAIAAELDFGDEAGIHIRVEFDFRQTGPQTWDIAFDTDAGLLTLSSVGARLTHDGRALVEGEDAEYQGIYRRFVSLIETGASDVDLTPMMHVADAFLLGRCRTVEPFVE